MKRKDLWARLSSCTMAALIATTSVVPTYGADFSDGTVMEQTQETEDVAEADTVEGSADAVEETAETDAADVFTDDVQTEEFSSDVAVQADEQAEAQTGFGTANTQLAKGTYTVKASLMKGNDPTSASMAGSCIAGDATMVVAEDGSATVTVPIQSVTVMGMTGNAEQWKIYKGDITTETTDASATTGEDGKVNSITFTIPDKSQDGVYVNMYIDLMQTTQDAFLKLDYANAQPVKAPVDTAVLEATIAQAAALDEMSYTKASWDGNKDAIEAAKTAAKAALEAKESQEAVDAANTALADAVGKLVEAGDQTTLKETLARAKALNETDYTVKTWNYVKKYIDQAETVIANRDTKRNVNSANFSLDLYIGKLVPKYNTEKLEKKIAEAEALKKEDYTADSWKQAGLASVINAAKEVIENRGNKDDVHTVMDRVETAMDKLVPASNEVTVGRGNFQKKLAPGTYSIPVELLNGGKSESTNQYTSANYMSQVSMAHGCFIDDTATIVIHEDGTATFTAGVQAITAMGLTGAASDWTIYESTQDYLDGIANSSTGARYNARVDESKVQAGKKKPSKISFTIPDLKQNVVATNMYIEVMSVHQDACIGLDWMNIEKVSDDTSETSTVEREYVVKADTLTQLKNMKAGTTVALDEDVTLTEDLTIKGGTLDLNGHALNQADNLIMIKGDVTIIDSSAEKTGKITREKYFANSQSTTSISVQKGKITTILGANGCGKSTLFSLMTKNLTPDKGKILMGKKNIANLRLNEFALCAAIVHQYNTAADDITVERLVSFGRTPHLGVMGIQGEEDEKFVEWAMEVTNITQLRDRELSRLSGGQRQRVWIAMALAQGTEILFLDEPTTYLDIRYQIEILELVKKLNREYGMTIIMVLHEINQAIYFSDQIIGLCDGKVLVQGEPDEVITEESIRALYGIELKVTRIDGRKFVLTV